MSDRGDDTPAPRGRPYVGVVVGDICEEVGIAYVMGKYICQLAFPLRLEFSVPHTMSLSVVLPVLDNLL
jgi:hypothetical protein